MEMYKRIFVIVLDSLGIGAMPDAARFADEGADTFGHILEKTKTLNIPNLRRLGFLNLKCGGDMKGVESPEGRFDADAGSEQRKRYDDRTLGDDGD